MAASDLKDLHATALAQFKFVAEVEYDQRVSELEALKFEAGDQWPEEAKTARAGQAANGTAPAVPARPMLTMRTLNQPLAQIENMERNADLGITIVPRDGKGNKETADVIAGLVRAIQVDSHSDEVYSWGFQRMRSCGRGYWRVNKQYADEESGTEQVIRIEPIKNGASVYLDPMRKWVAEGGFWEPEYGFITQDMPEAEYVREFGQARADNASESNQLSAVGDEAPLWVIDGKAGRVFRIAEYFYAKYRQASTTDGRKYTIRQVCWGKLDAAGWIDEPQEWDGKFIPIIEDSGTVYNVGGKEIVEGMVQPSMAPCRMLNYMVSAAAEKIGLASMAPWIGVAGQFEGFEAWWDQANTRNFSKLEYNAVTDQTGSQLLPPPNRNNDEPAIQAFGEMIGLFTNFIRSTTGVPDAALGHVNPNDRSGKAIEELKRASELGTSGYLSKHATAIRHTGIVVVDLIPHIYDTPGRVERIVGKDGSEEFVMLNAPFVKGKDGMPEPYQQPGMFQRGMQAIGMADAQEPITHLLDRGRYGVIVQVGKSRDTLQAEALAGMNALAQAAPELVPRYADLWVKSMGIPEADAIAERVKPPGVDEDEQIPPQAQAMIAQMQAEMAELQKLADDNQAKLAVADKNNEAKLLAQKHADETKLEQTSIQAQSQIAVAEIKAGMEEMKQMFLATLKEMEQAHQTHLIGEQAAVDAAMQADQGEREDARAIYADDRADDRSAAEADREDARLQAGQDLQRELAVTPPPKDPNKVTKPNG